MKITCRKKIALDSKKDAILVPIFKSKPSLEEICGETLEKEINDIASSEYFDYKEKELESFIVDINKKKKKVYLMSIPKDLGEYRNYLELGYIFGKRIHSDKIASFSIIGIEDLYQSEKTEEVSPTRAFIEGVMYGVYKFDKYKKKKEDYALEEIEVITASSKLKKIFDAEAQNLTYLQQSIYMAKDLINEPSNELTPEIFANFIKKDAPSNVEVTIYDEKKIKSEGLNLLNAVGKGSVNQPRLVILKYTGCKEDDSHVALVGKGLMFDSGGFNLKTQGGIETMNTDMAGAAVQYAAFKYLALSNAKINVYCYLPLAENIIGHDAIRPGDIVKSASGLTVEILNTDAEGRLVLADALYLATLTKPEVVIDMATLTGAIIFSLGKGMAGLFSNKRYLAQRMHDVGYEIGEDVWELPLYEGYEDWLNSKVADLQNVDYGHAKQAGSIFAALFLQKFVDKLPWIHLDIAGVARAKHPWLGEDTTAFGVRLVIKFLKDHYAKKD